MYIIDKGVSFNKHCKKMSKMKSWENDFWRTLVAFWPTVRRSKYAGRPRGYRSDPDRFLIHQQVLVRSLSGFDFSPKSLGGDRSISSVPGR